MIAGVVVIRRLVSKCLIQFMFLLMPAYLPPYLGTLSMGGIGRAFNILHCHTATLPYCYRLTYLYTATHTSDKTHRHLHDIQQNKQKRQAKRQARHGMAWHRRGDNELNSWDFSFFKSAICFHYLTYLCAGNDRVSSYTPMCLRREQPRMPCT